MILADSCVWVDHLRRGDDELTRLLLEGSICIHPFVVGEIALGHLKQRQRVIGLLRNLPQTLVATDDEVQRFIETNSLFGLGIGYVDAHLLAAVRLMSDAQLWTRDRGLLAVARRLGLSAL